MKKLLVYLTVLFSIFLFTNKVSALDITGRSGKVYKNISTDKVVITNIDGINNGIVGSKNLRYGIIPNNTTRLFKYNGQWWVQACSSNSYCSSGLSWSRYYTTNYSSWSSMSATSYFAASSTGTTSFDETIDYSYYDIWSTDGSEILYCGDVETECKTLNEFTINTYDTEFGGDWFGVNYIQGEQDNTVNFYIQDSGILYMNYAKGYEIEKIYYDEALTQEANLNDIVETDTNLYVTWKSKIEINKQIATDLSGNDVITINYDFSKIYNEIYTYWISNDGTNYVEITDKLNSEHKYNSGVYFAGDYYARVQDENNETISVHYINIDYYRISPNTEIGKDIDENGNIKPYVIIDYSAYKEIKNSIICEYSIDNGNTWIDITNKLDINMKYKLYINIGEKVTSRVRTNGNTILPGETGGSNYNVTEDFYNDILINEEKDVLEEFKNLLTNKNDNIFIKFKEVWEAFKNSILFVYIMVLIIGALIILIIKTANRS